MAGDGAMTTAGLQAKVRLRKAWFEAHPNQPIPEGRDEVERLFAAIEAEAVGPDPQAMADAALCDGRMTTELWSLMRCGLYRGHPRGGPEDGHHWFKQGRIEAAITMPAKKISDYDQRRNDVIGVRLLGASAKSAAAWLSAINRAERAGLPCPGWDDLERLATSLPADPTPRMKEGSMFSDALGEHEKVLLALGRFMANSSPGAVDYEVMGEHIAAAVNGVPTIRAALAVAPNPRTVAQLVVAEQQVTTLRSTLDKLLPSAEALLNDLVRRGNPEDDDFVDVHRRVIRQAQRVLASSVFLGSDE